MDNSKEKAKKKQRHWTSSGLILLSIAIAVLGLSAYYISSNHLGLVDPLRYYARSDYLYQDLSRFISAIYHNTENDSFMFYQFSEVNKDGSVNIRSNSRGLTEETKAELLNPHANHPLFIQGSFVSEKFQIDDMHSTIMTQEEQEAFALHFMSNFHVDDGVDQLEMKNNVGNMRLVLSLQEGLGFSNFYSYALGTATADSYLIMWIFAFMICSLALLLGLSTSPESVKKSVLANFWRQSYWIVSLVLSPACLALAIAVLFYMTPFSNGTIQSIYRYVSEPNFGFIAFGLFVLSATALCLFSIGFIVREASGMGFGVAFRKKSFIFLVSKHVFRGIKKVISWFLDVIFRVLELQPIPSGYLFVVIISVYWTLEFISLSIWQNVATYQVISNLWIIGLTAGLIILIRGISELTSDAKKVADGNFGKLVHSYRGPLRKLGETINHMQRGLDEALERSIKSEKMKTALITNVSHDLKTPLTSIINYSDLLQNTDLTDEEREKYSQVIHQKSKRLKIHIEDLFEVSKATSGEVILERHRLDIVALLRQAIGEFEDRFEEKGIRVIVDYAVSSCILSLDGQKTFRILENILQNIANYTQRETRVYIDVALSDDWTTWYLKTWPTIR